MIRDITIGQYYPAKSILHRLDPRVKLVSTLLYLISLFLFRSISGYLVATLFLVCIIRMSKVPLSYIVKGLGTYWPISGSLRLQREGLSPLYLWLCV